jgi:alpha-beta hydrolase superfamily lysophospholipase
VVVVWGHSQGGHASLFAGQLAATYAPDLDVRGAVAAAPAAELPALLTGAASSPFALGFLAMAVHAYAATYPELEAGDVLTAPATADLGVVEQRCIAGVVGAFGRAVDQVVARSPLDVPAWAARIEENTPGPAAGMPVLVLQGDADPLVPAATTDALVRRLCDGGGSVRYLRYPGADHGSVLTAGRGEALAWMDARLAGAAAPASCGGRAHGMPVRR